MEFRKPWAGEDSAVQMSEGWRELETLWLVQMSGTDLFVSPVSYVTGTEREQGTSSPHQ